MGIYSLKAHAGEFSLYQSPTMYAFSETLNNKY